MLILLLFELVLYFYLFGYEINTSIVWNEKWDDLKDTEFDVVSSATGFLLPSVPPATNPSSQRR